VPVIVIEVVPAVIPELGLILVIVGTFVGVLGVTVLALVDVVPEL
jgi:hypothetical protein